MSAKKPNLLCRIIGHDWDVRSRRARVAVCKRCKVEGWAKKLESRR